MPNRITYDAVHRLTSIAGRFVAMNYADFWARYLGSHADRRTRALHYIGTAAALAALAVAALTRQWAWLVAAPVLGYGPAWIGHAAFERNRPETFSHPAWSLVSDFRMLWLAATGRLGGEMRRTGVGK